MKFKELNIKPIILGAELMKPVIPESLNKHLDMQAPSTRAVIERPISEDARAQVRSISLDAQVRKEDGTIDINERETTAKEIVVHEGYRRKSKNTQQISTNVWVDGKNVKDIQLSSATSEKKEKAVDTFMFTPPADLNEQEMKRLTLYAQLKELEVLPKEHKLSWLDKLLLKLKVRQADTSDRYSYAELQELWSKYEKE